MDDACVLADWVCANGFALHISDGCVAITLPGQPQGVLVSDAPDSVRGTSLVTVWRVRSDDMPSNFRLMREWVELVDRKGWRMIGNRLFVGRLTDG